MNRITPADAGKTRSAPVVSIVSRDHPRGCGENRMSRECRLSDLGSPPRMRGKHVTPCQRQTVAGITPADAGKTTELWYNICGG